MRVVVRGATGNLGTSCLQLLAEDRRVNQIVAIARRAPRMSFHKTQFVERDVSKDTLEDQVEGADAVVHLAWELNELLEGLREGAGLDTPRLWARTRAAERTISV